MTPLVSISSPFDTIALVLRLGAVGVAISSAELLLHLEEVGPAGLLDGEVQMARSGWLVRTRLRRPLARLARPDGTAVVVAVRLAAACALIVGAGTFEVARFGAITVAVVTLFLRLRSTLGIHASGSMVMITFTACSLGLLVGTGRSMKFAILFIALQAGLAYFVAGSSKLAEPRWRDGRAIAFIAATLMWGNRREAIFLRAHRPVALALGWMTMVGECVFPLALVLPWPADLGVIACAGLFHVATAVEMRLNAFVWAFGSTFPAILYFSAWLHHGHL